MHDTAWWVITGYYAIATGLAGVAIGFALGRFAIKRETR